MRTGHLGAPRPPDATLASRFRRRRFRKSDCPAASGHLAFGHPQNLTPGPREALGNEFAKRSNHNDISWVCLDQRPQIDNVVVTMPGTAASSEERRSKN